MDCFTFPYQKSIFQNNVYQAVTQQLTVNNINRYQNNDENIQPDIPLVESQNQTNNQKKADNNRSEQKPLKVHHKQVKNNLNIAEVSIVKKPPYPVSIKSGPTAVIHYASSEIALKFKSQLNEIGQPIEEKLYDTLNHISIEEIHYSQQMTNDDYYDGDIAEEIIEFDSSVIADAKLRKILDMLENDSFDQRQPRLTHSAHRTASINAKHCIAITVVIYFFGGFEWTLEVAKRFLDNLTVAIWQLLKRETNCLLAVFCIFLFFCLIIIGGIVRCIYFMNKYLIRPIYDKYLIEKCGI